MKSKRLLEKQVSALRYANGVLRQAVPPEKQKYLPEPPAATQRPPALKEKFAKILPKLAKALAVIVVLGAIAAIIAVEVSILSSKEKEDPVVEHLPESIPFTKTVSGLNAYFGGCAAEYGDRLYFLSSVNDTLCYLDNAGNESKLSRASVGNLLAIDKHIYYINKKTNLIEKNDVHNGDVFPVGMAVCASAIITEDSIYGIALEDGSLRKYDKNGNNYETLLSQRVKTVDKREDTVYALTENGDLYMIEQDECRLIRQRVYLSGIINGKLFFSDGSDLYSLSDEGEEKTGYTSKDFNGNGNVIVTQDPKSPSMLVLHRDGTSLILAADYKKGLTVTENHVVYTSVDGYKYVIDLKNVLERTLLP